LTGQGRIFVDMSNTPASTRTSSRPRNGLGTQPVPTPQSRPEASELRELLESYLAAMDALLDQHRETLARSLRACLRADDAVRGDVLAELRALGDRRAPWVTAIEETRALLFVALRELIVGDDAAGLSLQLAAQPRRVA